MVALAQLITNRVYGFSISGYSPSEFLRKGIMLFV